jgi:predicted nucleic acid-binding protein
LRARKDERLSGHLFPLRALPAASEFGEGHRLADILHVATALHLGVAELLTFDGPQKAMAETEGLTVPL